MFLKEFFVTLLLPLHCQGQRRLIAWVPFDNALIPSTTPRGLHLLTCYYIAAHLPPLNCSCSSQAPSAITVPHPKRL